MASRGVIAAYRPVLEPLRLTHPQYLVTLALWQHAPVPLTAPAGRLQMDQGELRGLHRSMTRLMKRVYPEVE